MSVLRTHAGRLKRLLRCSRTSARRRECTSLSFRRRGWPHVSRVSTRAPTRIFLCPRATRAGGARRSSFLRGSGSSRGGRVGREGAGRVTPPSRWRSRGPVSTEASTPDRTTWGRPIASGGALPGRSAALRARQSRFKLLGRGRRAPAPVRLDPAWIEDLKVGIFPQPRSGVFLQPSAGYAAEKRPNPTRKVERLPRSQASPGNPSSGAFLQLFRRPSRSAQALALDRQANIVSERVSIDLCEVLPAQLFPQTQPKLMPGVLQAPLRHPRVLHRDRDRDRPPMKLFVQSCSRPESPTGTRVAPPIT